MTTRGRRPYTPGQRAARDLLAERERQQLLAGLAELGMTRTELARRLRVGRSTVSTWCAPALSVRPSPDALALVAALLEQRQTECGPEADEKKDVVG